MPRHDAAEVRGVVQVAGEADAIRVDGRQFCRLSNIFGVGTFGVLGSRAVTGFATLGRPAARCIAVEGVVRGFGETVEDLLVTHLAGFGAGVARLQRRAGGRSRCRRSRLSGRWGGGCGRGSRRGLLRDGGLGTGGLSGRLGCGGRGGRGDGFLRGGRLRGGLRRGPRNGRLQSGRRGGRRDCGLWSRPTGNRPGGLFHKQNRPGGLLYEWRRHGWLSGSATEKRGHNNERDNVPAHHSANQNYFFACAGSTVAVAACIFVAANSSSTAWQVLQLSPRAVVLVKA